MLQDLTSDWLRAASSLLVALGSRLPDMVCYSHIVDSRCTNFVASPQTMSGTFSMFSEE